MTSLFLKIAGLAIVIAVAYRILFSKKDEEVVAKVDEQYEEMLQQSVFYNKPQVVNVTEHVYVAVGYAIANMMMIEGKNKMISST